MNGSEAAAKFPSLAAVLGPQVPFCLCILVALRVRSPSACRPVSAENICNPLCLAIARQLQLLLQRCHPAFQNIGTSLLTGSLHARTTAADCLPMCTVLQWALRQGDGQF